MAHCEAEQVDQAEREGAGDEQRGKQVASRHLLHRLPEHRAARLQQTQQYHPDRRFDPPGRLEAEARGLFSGQVEQEKPASGRREAAPASGCRLARAPPTPTACPRATRTSQTGRGLQVVTPPAGCGRSLRHRGEPEEAGSTVALGHSEESDGYRNDHALRTADHEGPRA